MKMFQSAPTETQILNFFVMVETSNVLRTRGFMDLSTLNGWSSKKGFKVKILRRKRHIDHETKPNKRSRKGTKFYSKSQFWTKTKICSAMTGLILKIQNQLEKRGHKGSYHTKLQFTGCFYFIAPRWWRHQQPILVLKRCLDQYWRFSCSHFSSHTLIDLPFCWVSTSYKCNKKNYRVHVETLIIAPTVSRNVPRHQKRHDTLFFWNSHVDMCHFNCFFFVFSKSFGLVQGISRYF